ncbi:NAD(P)H-binding protein [Pedobacter sp. L105]|uniref:NmrA family NAD(P)-binding protein n=1 Tax=Pedobacter sp. L105 TaxID=1641871 RepID=UPI00131C2FE3|nr:NAD(P)H-binding protein [Pedobacter sp. L105]
MKIVITGSIGNIGKPLTQELVREGHLVTVISSKADRQGAIEALGAKAAIGSMQDIDFLSAAFKGADIVYLMEAWESIGSLSDNTIDFNAGMRQIGYNYKEAIERSGLKRIVHLSSFGAHAPKGFGSLVVHHDVEHILRQLPDEVSIKFMRPASFYTNLFMSIHHIKERSAFVSSYGGDKKEPWVSPLDIAATIAEEMKLPFNGKEIRYIASEEISPNEIAKTIGEAIGKPDLKWLIISDEQLLNGMLGAGYNTEICKGLAEMYASHRGGIVFEDYYRHKPVLGKVKFKDFAKDFAKVFDQQ